MGLLPSNFGNALAAKTAQFARPADAFVTQVEPRSVGVPARGVQIMSGNFLFAGELVEAPGQSIWDVGTGTRDFEAALQGFGWMDHVIATGTRDARARTVEWMFEWIERYGGGSGPGWTPELAGRRVVRWINHAITLLREVDTTRSRMFFKALAAQAQFLSRRWSAAPRGLPRFEALTGLIYCSLALEMKAGLLDPAVRALGVECAETIGEDGGISSRNAEELLRIFTLLSWAARALTEAGTTPSRDHLLAMERIAPTLRSLRLGDGGLGHFQASGRGREGEMDQSLADANIAIPARAEGAMGFVRMAQATNILLMDAAAPNDPKTQPTSPMAFEFSAGLQLVIVNSGPGALFGPAYRDASLGPDAVSALNIAGNGADWAGKDPKISIDRSENADFEMLIARHNGFAAKYGVTHFRTVEMAKTGALLRGRDHIVSADDDQKKVFDAWFRTTGRDRMPIEANFVTLPEAVVEPGLAGKAVSITLPNGAVWVLQARNAKLSVREGHYMQFGRLSPRATKRIVASADAVDYEGTIDWTLTRA